MSYSANAMSVIADQSVGEAIKLHPIDRPHAPELQRVIVPFGTEGPRNQRVDVSQNRPRSLARVSKGFRLEVGLRALGIGFERQHRSDRPQVDDSLRVEVLPGEEFAQRQRIARNFTLGRVILRLRPRVRAENNASALAEAAPLPLA